MAPPPHPHHPHHPHGGGGGHGGGWGGRQRGGWGGYGYWPGYVPYAVTAVEVVDPVANALAMLSTRPDWTHVYCAEPTVAGRVQMVSIQLGRSVVDSTVMTVARRLDALCGLGTTPAGQVTSRPPSTAQYAVAVAVGVGVGVVAYRLIRKSPGKRRKKR